MALIDFDMPPVLLSGPFDTAVVEIDPGPFELEDLRHPSRKLELQPDGEEDEAGFQVRKISGAE